MRLQTGNGFLPPHPASPPTKRPLVALMKQARAFGVGVVIATQNPMDLDYRALGNAGLWCVGRLQTDPDRARVIEGLSSARAGQGESVAEISELTKRLAPRWFVMRCAPERGHRVDAAAVGIFVPARADDGGRDTEGRGRQIAARAVASVR